MISFLLKELSMAEATDDEKVVFILCEWTAGTWVYFSILEFLAGKTSTGVLLAILAILFAVAGVKWPAIKVKLGTQFPKVAEQISSNRVYRRIIYSAIAILLVVSAGTSLYRRHHKDQGAVSHAPAPSLPPSAISNSIDGLVYVRIPAGTFLMGCSAGDNQCRPEESHVHKVAVDEFTIEQTEVTVKAYKIYLQSEHRDVPKSIAVLGDDEPIGYVTWTDANGYCLWSGGRLPTETEWEYAARGGNAASRYGDLNDIAWYSANSGEHAHAVGQKLANGHGLYDVLGNAWEWTNDWYETVDPDVSCKKERVLRGASYHNDSDLVRVSDRNRQCPDQKSRSFGIRCVQDIETHAALAPSLKPSLARTVAGCPGS
jgi:sulfatase modifying factor 1